MIQFKLKDMEQKILLQKYLPMTLHIVCFLASVSQYRINYMGDYYLINITQ